MKILMTLLLIIWCFVIYYLSHQTGAESLETSVKATLMIKNSLRIESVMVSNILRNSAHFIEYFILSSLFYINLRINGRKTIYGLLFVCLISVIDELYQFFIPGRVMDFTDLMIDNLGNLLGYYITSLLYILKTSTLS